MTKSIHLISLLLIITLFLSCIPPENNSGSRSPKSEEIPPPVDREKPVISYYFTASTTESAIITLDLLGKDNKGITGWLISQTPEKPGLYDSAWTTQKPTTYTLPSAGKFTLYVWAKDADGNLSEAIMLTVEFISPDIEKPVVTLFSGDNTLHNTAGYSFSLEGTDNEAVSGYLINRTGITPRVNDENWSTLKPDHYTFPGVGTYSLYAFAKDEAGNISDGVLLTVNYTHSDNTKPQITRFETSINPVTGSTIPLQLDGSDDTGITGWLFTGSPAVPAIDSPDWQSIKPGSIVLDSPGTQTLYLWAKDEAGNISDSRSLTVECLDNEKPVISDFTIPEATGSNTIGVTLSAHDNFKVTGWMITETGVPPIVNDPGWLQTAPEKYILSKSGENILYAWCKDKAGNISISKQAVTKKITPWTVIIHMAIDNDIDYKTEKEQGLITKYLETVARIKALDATNNINILVLMDGFNKNTAFKDGYYSISGGSFANDLVLEKTEVNSGNPADTEAFFDWVISNYPAGRYMYSVFGYGSGYDTNNDQGTGSQKGLAFDETQNDSLSLKEVTRLTGYLKNKTGKKIDIFYPAAYLMGSVELAWELRNSTDYLVASQEFFPFDNWSFEPLETLVTDPDITTVEFGKKILDSAYTFFQSKRSFTLALIDLSKIDRLVTSLGNYSRETLRYITSDSLKAFFFNAALDKAFKMCSDYDSDYYYVDLPDFFSLIKNTPNLPYGIRMYADKVLSSYRDCLVHFRSLGYPKAGGLSLFHNVWHSNYQYPLDKYRNLTGLGKTSWGDYVKKMHELEPELAGDKYEIDDEFNTSNMIKPDDTAQHHTLHSKSDVDTIKINLSGFSGTKTIKIETSFLSIYTDTHIYLYSPGVQLVGDDNDGGDGKYSCLIYTASSPGIYTLRIKAHGELNNGDYIVKVSSYDLPSADSYEPDNDFNSVNVIRAGEAAQKHTLATAVDEDFVRLDLANITPGTRLVLETGFLSIASDTRLYLYDSLYNQIAYNDDTGDFIHGLYSRIAWTCQVPGIYYLKVNGLNIPYGDYTLQVRVE